MQSYILILDKQNKLDYFIGGREIVFKIIFF